MNDQLTNTQWQTSCATLDHIIQKISDNIQESYRAPSLPSLTNRTSLQGGFLSKKIQKTWKKYLSTYHLIKKIIYITKTTPNWQSHLVIEELNTLTHITIPPPPDQEQNQQEWIKTLAELAKATNIQARKITTKYTQYCIKKAISKYRQLYGKKTQKKLTKKS